MGGLTSSCLLSTRKWQRMIYCVQSSVRISLDGWKIDHFSKPIGLIPCLLSDVTRSRCSPSLTHNLFLMANIEFRHLIVVLYRSQHQERKTQHLLKMNLGYKLVHYSLKKFSNLINNPLGSSYSGYFINQLSHSSSEISKKKLFFRILQSSHPLHYRVWSDCTQW